MSEEGETARIEELTRQAAAARKRLKSDVEALAYKVSPENLKQEAVELTEQVASDAKAAIVRLGAQAKDLALEHPLVLTASVGCGGLLCAAIYRDDRRLLFAALAFGVTAVALGIGSKPRTSQPWMLAQNASKQVNHLSDGDHGTYKKLETA